MTLAEEILAQQDIVHAMHQKRLERTRNTEETRKLLSDALHNAVKPLPKAKNRIEMFTRIASNAFTVFQGVRTGMHIVHTLKSMAKGK